MLSFFKKKSEKPPAPAEEKAEFMALVDELDAIYQRRSYSGTFARPGDMERRDEVERLLLELLSTAIPQHTGRKSVRLLCNLKVRILLGDDQTEDGVIVDMGAGGVFVQSSHLATLGDPLTLETVETSGLLEAGTRFTGKVAWASGADAKVKKGFGLQFEEHQNDAVTQQKLRSFVIELLRFQIKNL